MEQIVHIDYGKCFKALLRKLPLSLFAAILCGILCAVYSFYFIDRADKYTARSSVLTRSTNEYGSASEGVQYAELVKSLAVADRAMRIIGDNAPSQHEIYEMITVQYDNSTPYVMSSAVINIYAVSTDPAKSITVTNAVAQAFVDEVNALIRRETDVTILDQASVASKTYNARNEMLKTIGIGAAGGFLIVCAIIVLLEILALRMVCVQDATLHGKLEVLGVIPNDTDL